MDLMQWLTDTAAGEFCFTALVSMIPVVELRGGIPFGVARGLPVWAAFLAAVIGNILPVPFIIIYIRRIFLWIRRRIPWPNRLGLLLFVAIPLPGTGAWTGSLAAAFLDMPLRKALPSIIAGVLIAGVAISVLTYGVASLF